MRASVRWIRRVRTVAEALRLRLPTLKPTLPQKISGFVVLATFLASLVVTATSVEYLQRFLRANLDRKFPATLRETSERLNIWYAQRPIDLATFAESRTVAEGVATLSRGGSSKKVKNARHELRDYLSQILEGISHYEAFFLMDSRGTELLRVGNSVPLPRSLRAELALVTGATVSRIHSVGGHRIQVVSTVIRTRGTQPAGMLHALFRPGQLQTLLETDRLGPSGRIFLLDHDGIYLTAAHGKRPGDAYSRPLPEDRDLERVHSYTSEDGRSVVGSAMKIEPFGWTMFVEESYEEAFGGIASVTGPLVLINLVAVMISSLFALWMSRSIVRPLRALSDGARRIADGETAVVIMERTSHDEIGLLTRTFNRMSAHLHRNQVELQENRRKLEIVNSQLLMQNSELQEANSALEELSITDGLTKLKNHRFFQEHLRREISISEVSSDPLVLILLDIDHFKHLNDRYGHAAGDEVLKKVADLLRSMARETDIVARYGGEEFALVPRRAPLEIGIRLAEKIRLSIAETAFEIDDAGTPTTISLTVSVGVAEFKGDRLSLFNDADRALYRAKETGRDCVVVDSELT